MFFWMWQYEIMLEVITAFSLKYKYLSCRFVGCPDGNMIIHLFFLAKNRAVSRILLYLSKLNCWGAEDLSA